MGKTVRLGAATGWSRDRFGPAEDLAKRGNLDYICYECMSEITMSAAQVGKLESRDARGYDPYLEARLAPVLKECQARKTKIISNQGWLEPVAAAEKIIELAKSLGLPRLKVAAVSGGILTDKIADMDLRFLENGEPIAGYRDRIVSAEAYLGAREITEALRNGADVVITTRVADACLYLGPLAHEFDWSYEDYDALARGIVIGHLMECACQVTGGYFADPGYKDVPDMGRLGHPIAEISEDKAYITKLPGTGGVVSTETCKEQLLYEVQDPGAYLDPDVVSDFATVRFKPAGKDRVEVTGAKGRPEPPTLKALIGVKEGYLTEEMVLFAGPGAMERAELAKSILLDRFEQVNLQAKEMRLDYLGLNSVHREASPQSAPGYEVILRISLKTDSAEEADKLRKEVDPMAVNGPAATGKWSPLSQRVRPIVGLYSALVPRAAVTAAIDYREL